METKPKISIFLPNLAGGGAERSMVNLANGIAERGNPVDLVLCTVTGPYLDIVSPKVNIVDLKASRARNAIPNLAKYLKTSGTSALLSSLTQSNVSAIIAKKLSGSKVPVIVNEQNDVEQTVAVTKNKATVQTLKVARILYPFANGITVVSKQAADTLARYLKLPRERVETMFNPVVTPSLFERFNQPIDHPWFAEGQPPVIIGIGRLTKQKNFPMLLNAFEKVAKVTDARLLILGEGELREELETQLKGLECRDRVQLPGFADNPYAYLSRARIFALSSYFEGLPTVVIEALACGTPVVSTTCPSGPLEILDGGKYGKLTPVDDADAFAAALIEELSGPRVSPPAESYRPYELSTMVDRYLEYLLSPERKKR